MNKNYRTNINTDGDDGSSGGSISLASFLLETETERDETSSVDFAAPSGPIPSHVHLITTTTTSTTTNNHNQSNVNHNNGKKSLFHFNKKKKKKRHDGRKPKPRWFSILYYITLSLIAITFTIAAKNTKLWLLLPKNNGNGDKNDNHDFTNTYQYTYGDFSQMFHRRDGISLLIHYLMVLFSFFMVQGSDPGYLTLHEMEWVCRRDGLTPLGHEEEIDEEKQRELENNRLRAGQIQKEIKDGSSSNR